MRYFAFADRISSPRLFWSFRNADISGSLPYFGENMLTRIQEIAGSRLFPYLFRSQLRERIGAFEPQEALLLTMVADVPRERYTLPDESGFEIQFGGNINLVYK